MCMYSLFSIKQLHKHKRTVCVRVYVYIYIIYIHTYIYICSPRHFHLLEECLGARASASLNKDAICRAIQLREPLDPQTLNT